MGRGPQPAPKSQYLSYSWHYYLVSYKAMYHYNQFTVSTNILMEISKSIIIAIVTSLDKYHEKNQTEII